MNKKSPVSQIRDLKLRLKETEEDRDRWEEWGTSAQKAFWILFAALGYPRIANKETYDLVVLRTFMKTSKLPLPWRRLMKKDGITVARAIGMFEPGKSAKERSATAIDEAERQIYNFNDRYMSRWFRKFARTV